jgi:hypothetical protein
MSKEYNKKMAVRDRRAKDRELHEKCKAVLALRQPNLVAYGQEYTKEIGKIKKELEQLGTQKI